MDFVMLIKEFSVEHIEDQEAVISRVPQVELPLPPSVFDGVGSESPSMATCTGCGNTYFFAVKLAI